MRPGSPLEGAGFAALTSVHVPVIADAEHTYDSNTAQTIQLDAQGSALYYFPALLSDSQQTALLDELDASLRRCQSRPHPFGLCPLASQCGHEQWFCMGPKLRANSRWRRFSLPPPPSPTRVCVCLSF